MNNALESTCRWNNASAFILFKFTIKIRIIQINQKSEPITDWYKVRISTVWCG